jgi:hypothetical protein
MNPFGARVTQLSFKRLPEEHADVMLRAGKLFLQSRSRRRPVPYLIGAVIFGIVCGVGIEAFRQFVLAPYFGINSLPTIQVVAFEMLPVMLAIGAGAVIQREIVRRGRRKRLITSLAENVMIDVDIYERGMETSIGGVFAYCSWPAFLDVQMEKNAITFFRDDALFSIPARAFRDRKEFEARGREIVDLWRRSRSTVRAEPSRSEPQRAEPVRKDPPPLDLGGETRH